MIIEPTNLNYHDAHHLMVATISPRPIAWVSTVSADGIFNLAPFSFFGGIATMPPTIGFCVGGKRDGSKKDTLINIEATKEFVVNVVTEELADAMVLSSSPFPADVDEFKEAGMKPVKADLVKAPRVAQSPVSMECRMLQILEYGVDHILQKGSFIIGRILRMHVHDDLLTDGAIDPDKLKPIGRMGGELYCRTRDTFTMSMPDPVR